MVYVPAPAELPAARLTLFGRPPKADALLTLPLRGDVGGGVCAAVAPDTSAAVAAISAVDFGVVREVSALALYHPLAISDVPRSALLCVAQPIVQPRQILPVVAGVFVGVRSKPRTPIAVLSFATQVAATAAPVLAPRAVVWLRAWVPPFLAVSIVVATRSSTARLWVAAAFLPCPLSVLAWTLVAPSSLVLRLGGSAKGAATSAGVAAPGPMNAQEVRFHRHPHGLTVGYFIHTTMCVSQA